MSRISLNKTQWSKIQPHLSGRAATGRPPADDKRTLEAILFVLTTGCRWRDLPSEYDGYVTAWRLLVEPPQVLPTRWPPFLLVQTSHPMHIF